MASKLLRRSGIACGLVADVLGWQADIVVQVGVGQYHQEVDVLKEEWPGVRFIGFEPCPNLVNDYPGELRLSAVSNKVGQSTLHVKRHHKDGSSLFAIDGADSCNLVQVPTTTLDTEFFTENGECKLVGRVLLWLDCEGSEFNALQGGEDFVTGCVNMVNVEMTSKPQGPDYCKPAEVHGWLAERGFRRQWVHTGRISAGQYDAIYVKPYLFKQEYCCDPWNT